MSRHYVNPPMTKELKAAFCTRFKDIESLPETVKMAWGLDIDGYFLQLWIEEQGDDLYLEDGLMGTNKSRIVEKLDKYGLLPFLREKHQEHLDCLVLDLPF